MPLGLTLLYKVLPFALGGALCVYLIARIGWDLETAVLLTLATLGMGITGSVLLQWGALRMPTRVAIPGFLTGVSTMAMAVVYMRDSLWHASVVTTLFAITAIWWSRARQLERFERLRQQMR
jgi:hypothetical protein